MEGPSATRPEAAVCLHQFKVDDQESDILNRKKQEHKAILHRTKLHMAQRPVRMHHRLRLSWTRDPTHQPIYDVEVYNSQAYDLEGHILATAGRLDVPLQDKPSSVSLVWATLLS